MNLGLLGTGQAVFNTLSDHIYWLDHGMIAWVVWVLNNSSRM